MATTTAIVSSTFAGFITIWNGAMGSVIELVLGLTIVAFVVSFMISNVGKAIFQAIKK